MIFLTTTKEDRIHHRASCSALKTASRLFFALTFLIFILGTSPTFANHFIQMDGSDSPHGNGSQYVLKLVLSSDCAALDTKLKVFEQAYQRAKVKIPNLEARVTIVVSGLDKRASASRLKDLKDKLGDKVNILSSLKDKSIVVEMGSTHDRAAQLKSLNERVKRKNLEREVKTDIITVKPDEIALIDRNAHWKVKKVLSLSEIGKTPESSPDSITNSTLQANAGNIGGLTDAMVDEAKSTDEGDKDIEGKKKLKELDTSVMIMGKLDLNKQLQAKGNQSDLKKSALSPKETEELEQWFKDHSESIPLACRDSRENKTIYLSAFRLTVSGLRFADGLHAPNQDSVSAMSVSRKEFKACPNGEPCCVLGAKDGSVKLNQIIGSRVDQKNKSPEAQSCEDEFLMGVVSANSEESSYCKAANRCAWHEPSGPFKFPNCFHMGFVATVAETCDKKIDVAALNQIKDKPGMSDTKATELAKKTVDQVGGEKETPGSQVAAGR